MNTRTLLLFVHGLGGDAKGTWEAFPGIALEAVRELGIPSDFEAQTFEYPSSALGSGAPKVPSLARALRDEIEGRYSAFTSVLLVAHSLGGMVCKELVLEAIENRRPFQVAGLLLYAVPNRGSAWGELADNMGWFGSSQAKALARNSHFIELHRERWYRTQAETRLPVWYVVGLKDRVVLEDSAAPDPSSVVKTIPDRGHTDIVKPRSRGDRAVEILGDFVRQATPVIEPVVVDLSHRQGGSQGWGFGAYERAWRRRETFPAGLSTFDPPLATDLHAPIWQKAGVLVLALGCDRLFTEETIRAVADWVEGGGGLLLLGSYAADVHHGANPSDLSLRFDIEFVNHVVLPRTVDERTRSHVSSTDVKYAVRVRADGEASTHPILEGVDELFVVSGGTLGVRDTGKRRFELRSEPAHVMIPKTLMRDEKKHKQQVLDYERDDQSRSEALMIVAFEHGRGRVVVASSWKLCTVDHGDNRRFLRNVLGWLLNGA